MTAQSTVGDNHFSARRARFLAKLPAGSVAIFVSNPEQTRSNDTEFPYRQSSDVLYLSAFPEPESLLILTNIAGEKSFQMLVRAKDRQQEIWTGIRCGVEGARTEYGAEAAYTVDEFKQVVAKLLGKAQQVYYTFGRNEHFDKLFTPLWTANQKTLANPEPLLHEMRLFKAPEEVALMRIAGEISADGHCQAMRQCQPGVSEYELQAVLEGTFRARGADAPAYGSIVAGGNNAIVLHYVENHDALADGDLVLIDAACEYQGYAADITRTFPVNGKFSEAQREIYELVLKAQVAAIASARAGVPLVKVHETAQRVLRTGLVKLGILPKGARVKKAKQGGKAAKGSKPALSLADFFMHGTSHWIGLDVHDVGSYSSDSADTNRRGARTRLLEPGMAITVEPGLYFDKDDKRVARKYRGIGVRIEDDVVITADGNEVLTAGVPKTVADIEALMARDTAPVGADEEEGDISIGERFRGR